MGSTGSTDIESMDLLHLDQLVWTDLPVGLVLLDGNARVTRANDVATRILTPTGGDLVGQDLFALSGVADRADALTRYQGEWDSGDIAFDLPIETSAATSGGRARAQIRSVALDSGQGQAYAILEDLGPLRSEQARRVRAERLATAGEATVRLAHELKNNLQSVTLLTELLGREVKDPRWSELLRLVTDEARRAEGLMKRQLALASGPDRSTREQVDLNDLLYRVINIREASFSGGGIRVRLDLDRALPRVSGDPATLLQVLLNLVINAEDALAGIMGEKRLILRTRKSSEGVVLAVVDNGPGMGPDTLKRAFDPFFSAKPKGSGLGLSISSAIVTDHRGRLWAESEPENGTAFFVQLPVSESPLESEETGNGLEDGDALLAELMPSERDATGVRVLVVDDEPVIRLAVQQVLGAHGHVVYAAPDATEALRIVETLDIDIALIDMHMPGDIGCLLEKLSSMPGLKNRIVLISADPSSMRAKTKGQKGVRFLPKPFSYDELVSLVESTSKLD